jgi:hypothetical protein
MQRQILAANVLAALVLGCGNRGVGSETSFDSGISGGTGSSATTDGSTGTSNGTGAP